MKIQTTAERTRRKLQLKLTRHHNIPVVKNFSSKEWRGRSGLVFCATRQHLCQIVLIIAFNCVKSIKHFKTHSSFHSTRKLFSCWMWNSVMHLFPFNIWVLRFYNLIFEVSFVPMHVFCLWFSVWPVAPLIVWRRLLKTSTHKEKLK